MELVEQIQDINKHLVSFFGIDTISGQPIWRVVFSDDQLEKRLGTFDDHTPAGIYLRTVTEVRLVPKYRQWIHQKYLLERLVAVPEFQQDQLVTAKLSYEPIFVFEDKNGNYLPPRTDACKFIIDTIYSVQYSNHNLARYKDPEETSNPEEALEIKKQRIDKLVDELFGDELGQTGLDLLHGQAITVPEMKKE